ncbi:diacylglycerol kinase [Corynebacterium sp. UBA2622]|uniref:diacylglycerol kinase n=1 Tax=Corynebacterium sp. UBA2622 TaxID=1946393 RepID=UPI0025BD0D5C|nr:diacylglycerol kinase [Corynebacterium sp. UBA2622]
MRPPTGTLDVSRVALLTNPAAGKGRASDIADVAKQRFNQLGVDVVGIQGPDARTSEKLAEAMIADERIDALVVAGGDGLIALALQAQAATGTPLGIIPAGTGNDHAREYGIPTDPARAAEVVAAGRWTATDLGRVRTYPAGTDITARELPPPVGEQWFGTIACAGFDSLVSDRTNRMRWPTGKARYNLAIAAEVINFRAQETTLVLDAGSPGERVVQARTMLCAVGNTRTYGGGMKICPGADHADGLLDLTVMGDIGRIRALGQFRRIMAGTLVSDDAISMYRSPRVRIAMPGINAYADGDPVGPLPAEIEAVPGAGMYFTPRGR